MRKLLKKITHPFLKKGLRWYYSRPRKYRYDGIEVLVHPDVFPPHLTFSTKILLNFIATKELAKKRFLELGCGSGIISLYAAKKGAKVTATDINPTALSYLEKAAKKQHLTVEVLHSDLFEALKQHRFDSIFINPPYYPKNPKNTREQAWFCGEDFEYFEKLFLQLPFYLTNETEAFMILSEDCAIDTIKKIAQKNAVQLYQVVEKIVVGESNFIFKIEK